MRWAIGSSSGSPRSSSDQIRSQDFLALERSHEARDLHARFGGDEFCFLIPDLPGCSEASIIAERFKASVEGYDWRQEDERLAQKPVGVDVGVVCLRLGPVSERRGVARKLAAELIHRADKLMYDAKGQRSAHVHSTAVRVDGGTLVEASGQGRASTGVRPNPREVCGPAFTGVTLSVSMRRDTRRADPSAPCGGCSSVAERRTVAPEVAGSNPVIHPKPQFK